jgi:uncharacterized protein (TIRG00374 family)
MTGGEEMNKDCGLRIAELAATKSESRAEGLSAERKPRQSAIRNLQSAIGYLLALAGLIWALRGLELPKLLGQVARINWWLIALAVLCDVLSYLTQGKRWQLLLKPVGEVSTLRSTEAIYAGLFTSEILPLRPGELVRAWLISRWTGAGFISVMPSIVVERLFDGLWLAVGIGLTALFVPLPKELLRAADALGVIVIIAAAALFYFALRSSAEGKEKLSGLPGFISAVIEKLAARLRDIGRTQAFYWSFACSALLVFLQALAFWLVMLGYGLHLSFWVGMAVFTIVHLGTAIPNAPANVGSYQFFCVLGLTLFGVDKTDAAGFSLVVFTLLTLPLLALGSIALSRSGTTLLRIRREIQRMAKD